jgi:hypothetical protein
MQRRTCSTGAIMALFTNRYWIHRRSRGPDLTALDAAGIAYAVRVFVKYCEGRASP